MREPGNTGGLEATPRVGPRRLGTKAGGPRLLRPPRPVAVPGLANDHITERARNALVPRRRPRVPVIVICSARPRVGRTLLARLVTEYFLANGRPAIAFDANPNDPALSGFLPIHSVPAEIADTRGQMALFDQLVVNDGVSKIVDLAPELSRPFFDLVGQLEFIAAARARSIDTLVLFLAEEHPRSAELCNALRGLAGMTLVSVHNEAIAAPDFPRSSEGPSLRLAALSPLLHGVINRRGFSFADYLRNPSNAQTGLNAWISRAFLGFRALELRLLLAEVDRSFGSA